MSQLRLCLLGLAAEWCLLAIGCGEALANAVTLQNATADISFAGPGYEDLFPPYETIDGHGEDGTNNGWSTDKQVGAIVWETASDLGSAGGTLVTFTMLQDYSIAVPYKLGKFRLSVTTDSRDTFADGLPNGGDIVANWTVLSPSSVTTTSGDLFSINPDGSIGFAGTSPLANQDTYTVTASTTLQGITGFRLEVMDYNGTGKPGLAFNGNFVLTDFVVSGSPIPEPSTLTLVAIAASGLLCYVRRKWR